jgi:hypothetical protein
MLSFPILKELDLSSDSNPSLDALESNLHILRCNAIGNPALWEQFLMHLCWPEEVEVPESLFLMDVSQSMHYKLAMKHIEQLYPH